MEIFHPAEILSRDEIAAVQTRRLARVVKRAARSPFYKAKLDEMGVDPESITSLDDLTRLPLTTKDDLRASYPFGMLADEHRELVRLHASSGTTGAPTVVYHTEKDLRTWADLMARCMHMAGMRKEDVFQNIAGYGLFTGGLGIHYGAERLGCLTIPAGAGNTARQIKLLRDFNVSAVHIIPSYALYLAGVVAEQGLDPRDLPPRIALIGAEPHSEEARRRIEEMLGLKAYNSYGLSEMNGPGVAFECEHQNGMHLWEDSYIAEILDPQTQEPVAEGEVGELVMTTLTREAMPLLRYRTRDLTRFLPGECACGRLHRRIDRITGRADDMLIIKGVNIYPMQIEKILLAVPEVAQNYQIVLEREGYIDQIKVRVEIKEEFFIEDMRVLGGIQKRIAGLLRNELLVTPRVELVEAKSLPTSEGKASRVVDLRETKD
ncbi:phenylacetate--CoA ligase family protein [Oceanidesulfovibrio marinus]|uniref:Phenylacetate-coenzyme A ligase n=1 Tax=Oceanidesulfovibrio marinus TaxID=370038 RepID=A0ABX6NKJ6_9BACT|nr:phenylacetate--CoA ligase [Oceanidesulfovibrio marinus]QJT10553.1 phenylacetate--CoA ligase [Oceanidesulfovibrio marinus]